MVVRVRGDVGLYKARGLGRLHRPGARHRGAAGPGGRRTGPAGQGPGRREPLRPPAPPPAARRCRSGSAWWPAPAPRATTTSSAASGDPGLAFAVTVAPTAVQGKDAPAMVAAAIADLQSEPVDIIVVVRGAAPRRISPRSTRRPWPGPSPPRTCRCGPASDTPVTGRWPTRWPTVPSSPRPSAARSWPGLALDYWRHVRESGARRSPGWPGTGCSTPTGTWPPTSGPWPPAPASSSTATRDGLGPPGRSLRTVARGQVDTHAARLAVVGVGRRPDGRAAVQREPASTSSRARGGSPGCPAQRLELEELRAAQRRRLLGAYDYQRQLERGYSVTRDASGAVLRSVDGLAPGHGAGHPAVPTAPSTRPSPAPARRPPRPRHDEGKRPDGHTPRETTTGRRPGRRTQLLRRRCRARRDHRRVRDRGGRRRPPGRPARAGHRDRRRARPPAAAHPDAGRGAGAPPRGHRPGRRAGRRAGRASRTTTRSPTPCSDRPTARSRVSRCCAPAPPSRGRGARASAPCPTGCGAGRRRSRSTSGTCSGRGAPGWRP